MRRLRIYGKIYVWCFEMAEDRSWHGRVKIYLVLWSVYASHSLLIVEIYRLSPRLNKAIYILLFSSTVSRSFLNKIVIIWLKKPRRNVCASCCKYTGKITIENRLEYLCRILQISNLRSLLTRNIFHVVWLLRNRSHKLYFGSLLCLYCTYSK